MKKMSKRLITILTAFVLFLGPTTIFTEVAAEDSGNEVIILHTNDMHGQMDAKIQELAYVKAYKDKVNAMAIIDAGDAFQGLPLNNLTRGEKMAEIMGVIGYDAIAIGNHEFDYTRDVALGLDDGWAKEANFPLLSANILYKDANVGPAGTHVYESGVVLAKKDSLGNDLKVSVIGASTPETYVKADPRHTEGLEITEPIAAVKEEIVKAKYADSDIYIVTVHLGIDKETRFEWRGDTLAEELSKMPELTGKRVVVIDGHSHSVVPDGKKFGDNVIYGQTGGSLANLGEITINLDDFSKSTAKLVQIRDGYNLGAIGGLVDAPDAGVVALLEAADAEFDELTKEVLLDNLPIELVGVRELVRTRETNLGRLIADSMLDYALDTFPEKSHVAVMNGGGIRASMEANKPVTLKEVLTVMPYGNRIVQIDVTGKDLYAMYEHALKAPIAEGEVDANGTPLLQSDPAILHSSDSIRVSFDPRLDPGKRVKNIQIMDPNTGKMSDVDLNKTYKLVTLEFLAVGGDGFTMLGGARVEGGNDADVFADLFLSIDETFDWTPYEKDMAPYRVVPLALDAEDTDTPTDDKVDIPPTGIYTGAMASMATATIAAAALFVLRKREE